MQSALRWTTAMSAVFLLAVLTACDRDTRVVRRQSPPAGDRAGGVPQTPLRPGMPARAEPAKNPYAGDMRAIEEGNRLYDWMNCSGCHFAGGGGIGPPLMDDDWIYGGEPAQIFDSIASGRANGMPAYGDMLAAEQVWHIVAYVETLSQIERREERGQPGDPRRHER
jgi:cytochrome c oxidase cbb3-type subunit III